MVQQDPTAVDPSRKSAASAGLSGGVIATLSGAGLLAVFMAQNRQSVTVSFLFWKFTWWLWLVVLVAAVLGAFVWFGLGVLRRHRRRKARRAARDD